MWRSEIGPRRCLHALLFFLLWSGSTGSRRTETEIIDLPIDHELTQLVFYRDEPPYVFRIIGLQPTHEYQLRISFPSTTPAEFDIQLKTKNELGYSRFRSLLNTEMLYFTAEDSSDLFAIVTATPTGVSARTDLEEEPIYFNITCATRVMLFPIEVWKMIAVLFGFVMFAIFVAFPRSFAFLSNVSRKIE
eukprot:NODE_1721_length_757_cov_69.225397_g1672_i0.p1 GENE.NODE_1721_length_757_cov_69.225397_g1672_i0~~NODE_1721_length_757_cov_69.225397_g1672_i0.p1  ORF type:complete len:190 (+),score=3.76 NODE_1721_length_757_cov_69.225397_g1672_i0:106-675(+)